MKKRKDGVDFDRSEDKMLALENLYFRSNISHL